MKNLLAALTVAALSFTPCVAAPAFDPDPDAQAAAEKQRAEDAAKKAEEEARVQAAQAAQEAGKPAMTLPSQNAIPVPDLPVVNKTELDGGLIIEELKIGEGYEVKPGGAVVAHYHGTLKSDGRVFDSSFQRGEPIPFSLGGVIAGWQKGVPGMKIGGIRRLTIPAPLAYGEQARGPDLPANSDLVFVIQLVDALQIEDKEAGSGEEVGPQPVCVTAHTITGEDGKEIEKQKMFVWIPGENQGISWGMEGMRVGGKRIIKVPAKMNGNPRNVPGAPARPANVPLTVEVELLTVRNLTPPTAKK